MRHWLALLVVCVLVQTAGGLRVTFTPHEHNVGVQIDVLCFRDERQTYQAVQFVNVDSDTSEIEVRTPYIPRGESACTAKAYVFRNDYDGMGNPDSDRIAEESGYIDIKQ